VVIFLLAGLALVALAVTLVIRAGAVPRTRAAQNLSQIGQYGYTPPTVEDDARTGRLTAALDSLAGRTGDLAGRWFHLFDDQQIRNKLIAAGFYSTSAGKFAGYRILSTAGMFLLWLWLAPGTFATPVVALGFIVSPLAGWMLPMWFVDARGRRRLEQIDYELPELIDLLVVTVEAGVGFAASLQIASERLEGPLGNELRLVLQEQAMGLGINEALRNMLDRCDTATVRSFVRSILQGETLGVSIGQIMRNLATEMRKRRRAAAEERAQKAPIKMLFPLVFLIFPAMFVVLLGPAIYSFLNAFKGV